MSWKVKRNRKRENGRRQTVCGADFFRIFNNKGRAKLEQEERGNWHVTERFFFFKQTRLRTSKERRANQREAKWWEKDEKVWNETLVTCSRSSERCHIFSTTSVTSQLLKPNQPIRGLQHYLTTFTHTVLSTILIFEVWTSVIATVLKLLLFFLVFHCAFSQRESEENPVTRCRTLFPLGSQSKDLDNVGALWGKGFPVELVAKTWCWPVTSKCHVIRRCCSCVFLAIESLGSGPTLIGFTARRFQTVWLYYFASSCASDPLWCAGFSTNLRLCTVGHIHTFYGLLIFHFL